MENQNKVVEWLEKALASPDFPLSHLKAAMLEQTLFNSYFDKKTYTSKARALVSHIKKDADFKIQILENRIDTQDKIALGLEKLQETLYLSLIKKQQQDEYVQVTNLPVLKLILVSMDEGVHRAWQTHFGDLSNEFVEFFHGDILQVKCDAVVSPANCFGYMDGGIDKAYMNYFGTSIQTAVQANIGMYHGGIMKIGNTEVVGTGNKEISFLISTPTMLTPDPLPSSTINPYLAAVALFRVWKYDAFRDNSPEECKGQLIHTRISSIAIPGMGTGIGCVPAAISAHQVCIAYDEVILGKFI